MELESEFQKALILHQSGNIEGAKIKYEKILKKNTKHFNSLHMLGVVAYQKKNFDLAIKYIQQAINLNNTVPSFYNNLGNIYKDTKKFNQAIECYEKVYQMDNNHFGSLHNLGIAYSNLGDYNKALNYYEKALKINPRNSDSYINRGKILCNARRYYESFIEFNKALEISQNEKVYSARGLLLTYWSQYRQALEDFEKSLSINPDYAEAYNGRGLCFYRMKKFNEALHDFEKAFYLNKDLVNIHDRLCSTKIRICQWADYKKLKQQMLNLIKENKNVDPFISLGLFDDPEITHKISNNFIKNLYIIDPVKRIYKYQKKEKINIGYYSPDFNSHPIAYLTHEIFENHDREKFNIFAFDFKSKKKHEIHKKIKNSFGDNYFYADQMSDVEICQLSRNLKIDLAIDLAGHTDQGRFVYFQERIAPIQVNYLGYPGTIGSDLYDYIIADKNIITKDQFNYYNEKIVFMPTCYQSNETYDKKFNSNFSKKDFNIPEDSFVYCCFNANWKYTPDMFDVWTKILKSVNKSILWLMNTSEEAKENLIKEVTSRGIEKERVIFANFLNRKEHLKRQRLADLFLDTFPYTAHTTCSDSLRSVVPVLTMKGKSFQSKVSASILKSCSLNELITDNLSDYQNLAIQLGNDKELYNKIKKKLIEEVPNSSLFNNKLFTKNLEISYEKMYDRFKSGLLPDHIELSN